MTSWKFTNPEGHGTLILSHQSLSCLSVNVGSGRYNYNDDFC